MQHDKSKAESFSLGRWLSEGIQRTQREGIEFARRLGFTGTSIKTVAREVEDELTRWESKGYNFDPNKPGTVPNTPEWRRVRCLESLLHIFHPYSYGTDGGDDWAGAIDRKLNTLRRLCDKAAPRPAEEFFKRWLLGRQLMKRNAKPPREVVGLTD